MKNMVKLCDIVITITIVIAAVALTMSLCRAWLEFIPYVNIIVGYSGTIFWRTLISLFWWIIARWFFKKLAGDDDEVDD